jgi:hypothetical protein
MQFSHGQSHRQPATGKIIIIIIIINQQARRQDKDKEAKHQTSTS